MWYKTYNIKLRMQSGRARFLGSGLSVVQLTLILTGAVTNQDIRPRA